MSFNSNLYCVLYFQFLCNFFSFRFDTYEIIKYEILKLTGTKKTNVTNVEALWSKEREKTNVVR
jgi:hypothetical protein